MNILKVLGGIRGSAVLLFAGIALWSVDAESIAVGYCGVEQVDPDTMLRMEMRSRPSCDTVIKNTRTLGTNQRYAQIKGRVYWMQEHADPHSIELVEIPGPVDFEGLQSYLDGSYASDGSVLLYGGHRVRIADLPINPVGLRRLPKYGGGPSLYVTDGRLVFYKDRVLEGADLDGFEPIARPTSKEDVEPEFARDNTGVYYGADRIPDADPVSFRLAYFPGTGDENFEGYFGLDGRHVWDLSEGFQLITPEYAEGVRQRLRVPVPATPEPWEVPRQLKVCGWAFLLIAALVLISRVGARIESRYQASLFSRAVCVVSTAYLILPTIGYALLFTPCSGPSHFVVRSLIGIGLLLGLALLGIANGKFMRPVDAAAATVVQLGLVSVVLGIGMVPPAFVSGLAAIPAGISRQCPR